MPIWFPSPSNYKRKFVFIAAYKQWLTINEPHRAETYLLTCAPNEVSNKPAHQRRLIRVFVLRMKKLCILGYPKRVQWRISSDCAYAQVDLNLSWAYISKGTFSDVAIQIIELHHTEKGSFHNVVSEINGHLFRPRRLIRAFPVC